MKNNYSSIFSWLGLCAISLIFNLFSSRLAVAQTASYPGALPAEQRVIPPAPTTASLGKFGNTPVDLNVGAASISIPLAVLTGQQLSLNVSLSYRTTGVRVDELATWVGLGWSLNAGGVVTRVVRGLPDEHPEFGYYAAWPVWRAADSLKVLQPLVKEARDEDAATGRLDLEPDLYSINLPGQSASFVTNVKGRPVLTTHKAWQVTGNPYGGWTVVTEDGVRYSFATAETTTMEDASGKESVFQSAWHLTRIESADAKDYIDFAYETTGPVHPIPLYTVTQIKLQGIMISPSPTSMRYCAQDPPFSDQQATFFPAYQTQYLTQISTPTAEVTFVSDDNRQDINLQHELPARVLRALEVRPRNGGAATQRADFTYSYFNGFTALRLDAVKELGKPAYRFGYDARQPARQNASQDHWGYYNGAGNGTSLLPKLPVWLRLMFVEPGRATANRASNEQYAQAGILRMVQYPTGGRTRFTYESNTVTEVPRPLLGEEMRGQSELVVNVSGSTEPRDSVDEQIFQMLGYYQYSDVGQPFVDAKMFEVPYGADDVVLTPAIMIPNGDHTTPPDPLYRLYKVPDAGLGALSVHSLQVYPLRGAPLLAPGRYVLAVVNFNAQHRASLTLTMRPLPPFAVPEDRVVGGLRLKRVADYSNNGDSTLTTYDYTRYDSALGRRVSTGQLFSQPEYMRLTPCGSMVLAVSNVVHSLATQSGYHLGYAEVAVTKVSPGGNGTTRHFFFNDPDPVLRGLLTAEVTEDQTGRKVKRVENSYSIVETGRIPLARVTLQRYASYPCVNFECGTAWIQGPPVYMTQESMVQCQWAPIATTRERIYGTSATDTLPNESASIYQYHQAPGTQWHPLPAQVLQVLAPGDTLVTRTRYSTDYSTPAGIVSDAARGILDLQTRHVFNAVVERQQWRYRASRSMISGQLTEYQTLRPLRLYSWDTTLPVPAAQVTTSTLLNGQLLHDWRYRPIIEFERYDGSGNLLQQRRIGGLTNSYLWGYGRTLPIAEVRNAVPENIAYTSFEPESPGRWVYPYTARVAGGPAGYWALRLGRATWATCDSLSNGTYTLSFWAQGQPTVLVNQRPVALPASTAQVGAWLQYQLLLTVPSQGVVSVGNTGLLDELRLYPAGAQLTSYTYKPLVGIISSTDAGERLTTYEYDAQGRLERIRDERGNILTQQEYHYARP